MAKNRKDKDNKNDLSQGLDQASQSFKKTYNSIENVFVRAFRFVSRCIDKILFSERYAKLVAVCLAGVICLIVYRGSEGNVFTSNIKSAYQLENVAVVTNISNSTYEVSGLPETVNVTISGDTNDVQNAMQQRDNLQVLANLSEMGEGSHEVTLEPLNFSTKLDVAIEPSTMIVNVKKKISRSFTLGYDFINTNEMDEIYSLSTPEFEQNEVIVRASEERMNEIAYVKALIDVSGKKADFEQEAELVAYDQHGEKLAVDILPTMMNVRVKVTSLHKEVPIKVEFSGDVAKGKAIDSYQLDKEKVTIYGSEEALAKVDELILHVPLTNIEKDVDTKSITVPLMLPSGISVRDEATTVKVDIKLQTAQTKKIEKLPIYLINWQDGLQGDSSMTLSVDIEISGTEKNIKDIKASDFRIIADMSTYDHTGLYDVELAIEKKPALIVCTLDEDIIQVNVIEGD